MMKKLMALKSLEELESAVRSLNRGKSPGLDGLPPEFYVVFWDQVGRLILDSIKFAVKDHSTGIKEVQ